MHLNTAQETKIGFKLQPDTLLSLLYTYCHQKLCGAELDVEPGANLPTAPVGSQCGNTKLIQTHGAKSKPNTKHRTQTSNPAETGKPPLSLSFYYNKENHIVFSYNQPIITITKLLVLRTH